MIFIKASERDQQADDRGIGFAAKARGAKLGNYARISKAKPEATAARAEAMRPAIASTMHLSATAAADHLNRHGIATASGKQWQVTQVIRVRQRLDLR